METTKREGRAGVVLQYFATVETKLFLSDGTIRILCI